MNHKKLHFNLLLILSLILSLVVMGCNTQLTVESLPDQDFRKIDYSASVPTTSSTSSIPSKVLIKRTTSSTFTVAWQPVPGATGYEVQYKYSYNGKKNTGVINRSFSRIVRSTTFTGLDPNENHQVRVRSIKSGHKSAYSTWTRVKLFGPGSAIILREYLPAPSVTISQQTINNFTVHWQPVSGATGYELQYNFSYNGKKNTGMMTRSFGTIVRSSTFTDFDPNEKHRVRMRSLKSGQKSAYSAWKWVETDLIAR